MRLRPLRRSPPRASADRRCAAQQQVDRVQRGCRGDEEAVAVRTAETDVRDCLRNADLPDQRAVRVQAMHTVVRRGPQAAGLVDAEAVEEAGLADGETNAVPQPPAVDDVEDPDVAR